MIVTGDTLLIRDFILNELKHQFNLSVQIVSPTVKRTATTFKMQIFDGSQSNAAFKENSIIGCFNSSKLAPKQTPNQSTTEAQTPDQKLSKLLLAEDIDTVFADEPDFYYQLCKLLTITKVPVILTASNASYIQTHFVPLLQKNQDSIDFEILSYSSKRPKTVDLYVMCMLIYMFETKVRFIIQKSEMFTNLDTSLMGELARNTICLEDQHLYPMSNLVSSIIYDHLREGLPAILNKLQKCKGNFKCDEPESQLTLSTMFVNGLDSLVDQNDSIEAYADQLEHMSGMQEIEERISMRVDDLIFADMGFLHSFDDSAITQVLNPQANSTL